MSTRYIMFSDMFSAYYGEIQSLEEAERVSTSVVVFIIEDDQPIRRLTLKHSVTSLEEKGLRGQHHLRFWVDELGAVVTHVKEWDDLDYGVILPPGYYATFVDDHYEMQPLPELYSHQASHQTVLSWGLI